MRLKVLPFYLYCESAFNCSAQPFFASPNTNAIMSSIERKYYGVGSAVQATSRDIGITLGMGVLMLLFSLHMGTAQITPEYTRHSLKASRQHW